MGVPTTEEVVTMTEYQVVWMDYTVSSKPFVSEPLSLAEANALADLHEGAVVTEAAR